MSATRREFRWGAALCRPRSLDPVGPVAARLGNTPRMVQEVYQHVIHADAQAAAQLVGDLYREAISSGL